MNNKVAVENNKKDFDKHIFCKSRIVDPLFRNEAGKLLRFSDTFTKWRKVVKDELKPKEYFLKWGN